MKAHTGCSFIVFTLLAKSAYEVNIEEEFRWSIKGMKLAGITGAYVIFPPMCFAILMMSCWFFKPFKSCLGNNLIWLWDFA